MNALTVKPSDKLVKDYYAALGQYTQLHLDHEGTVRSAFQSVLSGYGKRLDWTLAPEYAIQLAKGKRIVVDGALLDDWKFRHGFWEAKDEHDDLEREIKRKIEKGYPRTNIIFQAPERAIMYQRGVRQGLNEDIRDPKNLAALLNEFFAYREPDHDEWEAAVNEFKERIPELAERAQHLIEAEKKGNRAFRDTFEGFYSLCRQAINPNLSESAVEKMLIQHLLTERIFRRVFKAEEFRNRNVIAAEIEKVIQSMTSRVFSRDQFLSELDRFYKAIERAADDKDDYSEKQAFLNTVYERFFQGFSPKEADTHGIVYTPQPIVDFMVRSVDDILKKEFGKSLADQGVHILDPFVGTGNFITRIIRQIGETRKSALPHKFEHELHCNEIMLLPYYIASMNIEHEYMEQTGQYKPFEGICLTDTFELAEPEQATLAFMSEENTARVKRQKASPIFVVIANPPYNVGQENENDNNKNRKYPELDRRVNQTYAKASTATNKNALSDPYVKAIRWASDRVGSDGIVAFVSNNSFLDDVSFDGMRKHLGQDFSAIYQLNLKGNARTAGERRQREGGNIFQDQIRVSVGITFFVRSQAHSKRPAAIWIHSVDDYLRAEQKASILRAAGSYTGIEWQAARIDGHNSWVLGESREDFDGLLPLGLKKRGRATATINIGAIFDIFSNGNDSGRDNWVYNFGRNELLRNAKKFAETYNSEVDRYKRDGCPNNVDSFVNSDEREIKWTRNAKRDLRRGKHAEFKPELTRAALYHPFSTQWLYPGKIYNKEVAQFPKIFPKPESQTENLLISVPGAGNRKGFGCLATNLIPTLDVAFEKIQCFPFYTYDEDGSNRRENITDWALEEFRKHYNDSSITKWDIFHYTYALLHSPEYRERYAANLKRELPRVPYAPDFRAFSMAGKRLAELHVNYEQQPEYPLERIETPNAKLTFRVEKMRLGRDKSSLIYNDLFTLSGIPPETYEYRLGNRSALEWVIDQYQLSTDKRSGITNDPNREDDPEYILRLIGQVIQVSLETVKIVKALPALGLASQPLAPGVVAE
jgi:predicted helicase